MSHSVENRTMYNHSKRAQGLYDPSFEHDACGVGFIANIHGKASYEILDGAVTGLKNLAHRGAIDADAVTGDGAGIMTQIPYALIRDFLQEQGIAAPKDADLALGMFFMPLNQPEAQEKCKAAVEAAVEAEGLQFIAWRPVPIDHSCLGRKAENTRPEILQAVIARDAEITDEAFARRLLLVQKVCTRLAAQEVPDFYVVSLSHKTVTYKGLLNAPQVRKFFVDFKSKDYVTSFAIFHQRFATNTFPDWAKAQPFRVLAHNGEINTIRGNRNNMHAREASSSYGVWGDRYKDLMPMLQEVMSDSASFDNCLQLMTVGGRFIAGGVEIMLPAAWELKRNIPQELRDFYRYHALMMEPWDGPAAIVYSDGRYVGASLDRNGLRPARYKVYEDGTVILASEIGLIPHKGKVLQTGRLGPAKMLLVDMQEHKLYNDEQLKSQLSRAFDYGTWCKESIVKLDELVKEPGQRKKATVSTTAVPSLRMVHGYDLDEEEVVLRPMIESGKEPIASMGDDTPLAVFSRRPRLIYSYFKQLFAQVTNPAIDSLRERSVMSLKGFIGGRLGLFNNLVPDQQYLEMDSPILLDEEYEALLKVEFLKKRTLKLDTVFPVKEGPAGLEKALLQLRETVRKKVKDRSNRLIVLSDRKTDAAHAPIPMLLAVGAVHSELVERGQRIHCDILCESAEVRDVHQVVCTLGFGANAIYPYFVLDLIRSFVAETADKGEEGKAPLTLDAALGNYRKAIDAGILKVMSKMGISTLFSYQGARIFEALGIDNRVMDECFPGTPSPIGGMSYVDLAEETLRRHSGAYPESGSPELWHEGNLVVNKKGGEYHAWSSKVVSGMNSFIRKGGDYKAYQPYRDASDTHLPVTIKDLMRLDFKKGVSVPLDEVEPIEDIRRRFTTAGMSLGAISPEMHETLAIAMNRIGGKSNSGEGGEDPKRFRPYENGDNANSAIKQVASGRFGVTAEYLANSREIEIKVAQGAKPGEGGQLMGWKVSPLIAKLRYSVPGVTLISPPPHHDIYSIEDLAQLIFDLKEVNPRAKVTVKLVSCSGVGTVAAGVAKAYADVILISGHDGGTGASPISSIKHAGSPWEIGLSEAHQVLMINDLRSRVTLRTDGGMKTGRDIVLATLLGAEEYNFGTSALIAGGCAMFRICHLNTCPVGVATQREDLRAKFRGKPEYIINYFNAIAQDVRLLMSKLGFRTIDEMVGRTDHVRQLSDPHNKKTAFVDFSRILHAVDPSWEQPRIHTRERNDRFGNEGNLDDNVLQDAKETIAHKKPVFEAKFKIGNTCRNVGTKISGEIAYLHGNQGMAPGTLRLQLKGSAGQGFGTFLVQGVRLHLIGEANDYVGKGMAGGEIIVHPDTDGGFNWHENTIIGNTCLYGATGGYLFAAGEAGERFAVRNSGATTVIEGMGDHGCEYMTGGTVVSLDRVGENFGAGMSGGVAFVYDPANELERFVNMEMVSIARLDDHSEIISLRKLIETHLKLTGSPRAADILKDWGKALNHFQRVAPNTAPEVDRPVYAFDNGLQQISV